MHTNYKNTGWEVIKCQYKCKEPQEHVGGSGYALLCSVRKVGIQSES